MGYVFISYSSKNKDSADAIKNLLNKNKVDTWMAPNDIPAGSKYASVIGNAIKNCSCFLLLLTNDSQSSVWVAKEVERAVNYKKVIIPLQLENVVLNDEFEMYISTDQITPIKKIDETTAEVQKLIAAVKTYTKSDAVSGPAATEELPQVKILIEADEIAHTGRLPFPLPYIKPGDMIGDKYEVLTKIKSGQIFTVYLARHNSLNKQWALKVIYKTSDREKSIAQDILKKLPLIKTLNHPSMPRIVEVIDTEDSLILVTDYIEGSSLLSNIKEYGAQPEDFAVQWAIALATIVSYLHSCSVSLYSALAADNIMVKPDGTVSLINLHSLVQFADAAGANEAEKEQAFTNDILQLGKVLYHTVTGLDPFNSSHRMRPIRKIDPGLSKGFEYILSKCTAPKAKNRYQTADALLLDLQHFTMTDYKLKMPPFFIKLFSRSQKNT